MQIKNQNRRIRLNRPCFCANLNNFDTFEKKETTKEQRIKKLLDKNIYPDYVEELAKTEQNYQRTLILLNKKVEMSEIINFVNLDKEKFDLALEYLNQGIADAICLKIVKLNERDYQKFIEYYSNQKIDIYTALRLTYLDESEQQQAQNLIDLEFPPEVACSFVEFEPDNIELAKKLFFRRY